MALHTLLLEWESFYIASPFSGPPYTFTTFYELTSQATYELARGAAHYAIVCGISDGDPGVPALSGAGLIWTYLGSASFVYPGALDHGSFAHNRSVHLYQGAGIPVPSQMTVTWPADADGVIGTGVTLVESSTQALSRTDGSFDLGPFQNGRDNEGSLEVHVATVGQALRMQPSISEGFGQSEFDAIALTGDLDEVFKFFEPFTTSDNVLFGFYSGSGQGTGTVGRGGSGESDTFGARHPAIDPFSLARTNVSDRSWIYVGFKAARAIPKLRQRQRDDYSRPARVPSNAPTSRQASGRRGPNVYS